MKALSALKQQILEQQEILEKTKRDTLAAKAAAD